MKSLFRLVRLPNLVIVAATQYALQYAILLPELGKIGLKPLLPDFQFFLLVGSTVLIAAGGYVVNDIEDVDIDRLNKPEKKRIVERVYPLSMCWKIYWGITILGFIISLYLAFFVRDFVQLAIYPAAVFLLWAYSKWFKRQFLIGNVVVAGFCAFVAWVVLYAQCLSTPLPSMVDYTISPEELNLQNYAFKVRSIFGGYAVFAFISTLFREIIKDIEDVTGDKAQNCRTLPIVLGVKMSRFIALLIGGLFATILLILSYLFFISSSKPDYLKLLLLNLTITLPVFYALFLLINAKEKTDYSRLSVIAKLIMLSGLIFILIMY
ncbi:MAG: geranylgeranylglycerol-phosphate geranylgeranyltransferase [Saprospiraceae bacterium]|nr:geranylgeranylglycerol-phosphate geranylgeranyltransferase [Saprospiraceae bacterium]